MLVFPGGSSGAARGAGGGGVTWVATCVDGGGVPGVTAKVTVDCCLPPLGERRDAFLLEAAVARLVIFSGF